jgi:hypothetical protein
MWQTLMDWLPDLHVGTFEIRDLLNLVMTGLGAYLAWLAIKMGRKQTEIAEKQHAIWEAEMAKKTDLRVLAPSQKLAFNKDLEYMETIVKFKVHNGGNKTAEVFFWEVLIPEDLCSSIEFIHQDGTRYSGTITHLSATEHYSRDSGHYSDRLSPFSGIDVTTIAVPRSPKTHRFKIRWRIRGEEGMVPPVGLAEIGFLRMEDGFFAVSTPRPGESVPDTDEVLYQSPDYLTKVAKQPEV